MAAPAYTTDLTLISAADAVLNWSEPGAPETGGGLPQNGTEFFIQGTACISKACAGAGGITGGVLYNSGSGQTIAANDAVYIWLFFAAPNTLLTRANGGFAVCIGDLITAYRKWYVLGNDNYAYGGWVCVAVDPAVAGSIDIGSPNMGTRQYFGAVVKTSATISKGEPFGVDVIRHGRTLQIVSGSVADGFGLFSGAATANDEAVSARWGIFQAIAGGYQLQGRFLLGTAGTAVDFRDSNTSILIANTLFVTSGFNVIEIRNAASRVDWTSISFLALGTVSRGNFIVTDNADVNWTGCTFTDVGTFTFLANTSAVNCVFRRTDKLTLAGATLTGCTIDNNRATTAVLAATPAGSELVTGCSFTSDGTGHGLEITGTAANMQLTNNSWSGYAASDGFTGNEAVYVNIASGNMTLTISGGTVPSVRTSGAVVTVISGAVSVAVNVKNTAGANIENARVLIKAATGGPFPFDVAVTIVNAGTLATVTHTAHAMATNDKVVIKGASLQANNGVYTITKISDNSYSYTMGSSPGSNPTGAKATFVVLSGLTNASGSISMSRVFPANQPISGYVRFGASPYYKPSAIGGEVSSAGGLSVSLQLISDT